MNIINIEVIALAIALSMDAFAVSIGLGAKRTQPLRTIALLAAIYFGLFQAIMPIIGYVGGVSFSYWIEQYAPWISFFLLLGIGGKMIFDAFNSSEHDEIAHVTHKIMLLLAIATSIDAMAAGFTLTLLDVNPISACLIIGFTTFVFSWLGVFVGEKSGTWLESKAELFGGVILIIIGIKTLAY
ncbi:manganese efflux pump MntP family protein [Thalassotalea piscium]